MIRINLLPFRAARKRENIKRQISIYVTAVCCALIIMGGLFFKYSKDLSDLKDEESRLTTELAGYQKELNEIKDLEKKIEQINSKLNVIKDLEKGKTGPVLLLSDISDAVPKDKLWLTSLSEKDGNLSLKGTAMDNETISLFMKNLEKTEQILDVPVLKSAVRRDLPELRLTVSDFDLECKTYAAKKVETKKSASKKGSKKK
ncbi:MAG: PilN domain-containing protein [Deltaproteobacteria bacterium]|nr:PilN domain-containing protein [Deltaproteobacteria bacterium]